MAYTERWEVRAGGYRGRFDSQMDLGGLLSFLGKVKPDSCYAATHIEVWDLFTEEKVAVLQVNEDGYDAYDPDSKFPED